MDTKDLTQRATLRCILRQITRLESKKEFLSARLLAVADITKPEFRKDIGCLGELVASLYQLRRLEKKCRGVPI